MSEDDPRQHQTAMAAETERLHQQNLDRARARAPSAVTIVPDDQGQAMVQQNGMLYVGREYAGEAVRWWVARIDTGRSERRRPDWWALESAVTRREGVGGDE